MDAREKIVRLKGMFADGQEIKPVDIVLVLGVTVFSVLVGLTIRMAYELGRLDGIVVFRATEPVKGEGGKEP